MNCVRLMVLGDVAESSSDFFEFSNAGEFSDGQQPTNYVNLNDSFESDFDKISFSFDVHRMSSTFQCFHATL